MLNSAVRNSTTRSILLLRAVGRVGGDSNVLAAPPSTPAIRRVCSNATNRTTALRAVVRSSNAAAPRRMLSLGNPMFPEVRKPDPVVTQDFTVDKSKLPDHLKNQPVSWLGRHGGKVALVAFSVAAALIYGFFQGATNKNKMEDAMAALEPVDPYEVNEMRLNCTAPARAKLDGVPDKIAQTHTQIQAQAQVTQCRITPPMVNAILNECLAATTNTNSRSSSGAASGNPCKRTMLPYTAFVAICNKVVADTYTVELGATAPGSSSNSGVSSSSNKSSRSSSGAGGAPASGSMAIPSAHLLDRLVISRYAAEKEQRLRLRHVQRAEEGRGDPAAAVSPEPAYTAASTAASVVISPDEVEVSLPFLMVSLLLTVSGSVDERAALLFHLCKRLISDPNSHAVTGEAAALSSPPAIDTTGTITYGDLAFLIHYLLQTCQIPVEKRAIAKSADLPVPDEQLVCNQISRYIAGLGESEFGAEPSAACASEVSGRGGVMEQLLAYVVHSYRPKTAEEFVDIATTVNRKQLSNQPPPTDRKDGSGAAFLNNVLTYQDFRLLLTSPSVCAWGECYSHDRS